MARLLRMATRTPSIVTTGTTSVWSGIEPWEPSFHGLCFDGTPKDADSPSLYEIMVVSPVSLLTAAGTTKRRAAGGISVCTTGSNAMTMTDLSSGGRSGSTLAPMFNHTRVAFAGRSRSSMLASAMLTSRAAPKRADIVRGLCRMCAVGRGL